MKKILMALAFFLSYSAWAQKNIKALINAENNFADYSVHHGVKQAFLQFLDTSSIIFNQGIALNGLGFWNKQKDGPGVLNWYPAYAEIAHSGDLGYTCGPWTYQPKTVKDSIVARGGFISVWKLDKQGAWKNIVDIGVNDMPSIPSKKEAEIITAQKENGPAKPTPVLQVEKDFNKTLIHEPKKAYDNYLSREALISRHHVKTAITKEERDKVLAQQPDSVFLTIQGYGISSSGDLGYVYGTSEIKGKKDNYLHVWRKERQGWKLAMDVLRY